MKDEIDKLDISDEMIAERRSNQNKMPEDMPKLMAVSYTHLTLPTKRIV